jgi:hypothetical protein
MKGWGRGRPRNNQDRQPGDVPYGPKTGKDQTKSIIAVRRLVPASALEQGVLGKDAVNLVAHEYPYCSHNGGLMSSIQEQKILNENIVQSKNGT